MVRISSWSRSFSRFLLSSPAANDRRNRDTGAAGGGTMIEMELVEAGARSSEFVWSIIDNGSLKNCEVIFQTNPGIIHSKTIMKVHKLGGRFIGSVVVPKTKKHLPAVLLSSGVWWCCDNGEAANLPAGERHFTMYEFCGMVLRFKQAALNTDISTLYIEALYPPPAPVVNESGLGFKMEKYDLNGGYHMRKVTPRAKHPSAPLPVVTVHDANFSFNERQPILKTAGGGSLPRMTMLVGGDSLLYFEKTGGDWESIKAVVDRQTIHTSNEGELVGTIKNITRYFNNIHGVAKSVEMTNRKPLPVILLTSGEWMEAGLLNSTLPPVFTTDTLEEFHRSFTKSVEESYEDDDYDDYDDYDDGSCPECGGTGRVYGNDGEVLDCEWCDGTGDDEEHPGSGAKNFPCILNPIAPDDPEGKKFIDDMRRKVITPAPVVQGVEQIELPLKVGQVWKHKASGEHVQIVECDPFKPWIMVLPMKPGRGVSVDSPMKFPAFNFARIHTNVDTVKSPDCLPPADAPSNTPTTIKTGDLVAVVTKGERVVGRVAVVEVVFLEPFKGHWNGRLVGDNVCFGVNGGCYSAHIETIPVVTPANKGV